MAHGPRYHVPYRRRREGRTDYRRRLALLSSRMTRAVVRRSGRHITVQFVEYAPGGDRVLVGVTSDILARYGWDAGKANTTAAYLTGYVAGRTAMTRGIDGAVLDIGLYTPTPGSRVFAALKGILDAGLDIPHSDDPLPSVERVEGLKGDGWRERFAKTFARIVEDLGEPEEGGSDD